MKVAIGTVALLFTVQASTISANEEEWLKAHNDRRYQIPYDPQQQDGREFRMEL